jgi:hypothetical protein
MHDRSSMLILFETKLAVDKSMKKHHTYLNLRFSLRRESHVTLSVPFGDCVRSPA